MIVMNVDIETYSATDITNGCTGIRRILISGSSLSATD